MHSPYARVSLCMHQKMHALTRAKKNTCAALYARPGDARATPYACAKGCTRHLMHALRDARATLCVRPLDARVQRSVRLKMRASAEACLQRCARLKMRAATLCAHPEMGAS